MADFTPEGLEKLKKELEYLKTTKRKEIAERLKQAIAFGDLSENAAYHEAKESQGFLEGRILELQKNTRGAKVIQKSASGVINLGAWVSLEIDDEKQKFEIVGPSEADSIQGKISDASPLGKALIGKRAGESGFLETNNRKIKFKIVSVN
jgi:transcription elongation factor GreA